jgi:ubiquinone/menaquinone biosynthesis C-methylase UbiE
LAEFTGERVIPHLVDSDLMNEHRARYRFAARFAEGAAVLDAGCGSGYGAAEFTNAVSVTGADISGEALTFARENFSRPGVHFVNAACEELPFAAATFDLITAFEVIEHLERWPDLLKEACRVLKPGGMLLISTPNKAYYAEMRASVGPNPFHRHEFEYEEFQAALYEVFPHVRIWAQNHAEAIVFAPSHPGGSFLKADGNPVPGDAHFFLAACSHSPIEHDDVFAWLPSSGNVLRERERHIAKLEAELSQKDRWLNELKTSHASLQQSHEATVAELNERSLWMQQLQARLDESDGIAGQLRNEVAGQLHWLRDAEDRLATASNVIRELESDLEGRTAWARAIQAELAERTEDVRLLTVDVAGYLRRIEDLDALRLELQQREKLIAQSKWMRLGRSLHLGPVLPLPEASDPGANSL